VRAARVEFAVADLLSQPVDAIVNPANERLSHAGGLAAAIARGAGPSLVEQSRRLGACPTGEAVMTGAGALPQRWVIHAVGPVWTGGEAGEGDLLGACHRALVARAAEVGARSLALPAISTGIFGYPVERAAPVAVAALGDALAGTDLEIVRFCFVDERVRAVYAAAAAEIG
jgi:O-acetyl-ADP-ribose deacetylase